MPLASCGRCKRRIKQLCLLYDISYHYLISTLQVGSSFGHHVFAVIGIPCQPQFLLCFGFPDIIPAASATLVGGSFVNSHTFHFLNQSLLLLFSPENAFCSHCFPWCFLSFLLLVTVCDCASSILLLKNLKRFSLLTVLAMQCDIFLLSSN